MSGPLSGGVAVQIELVIGCSTSRPDVEIEARQKDRGASGSHERMKILPAGDGPPPLQAATSLTTGRCLRPAWYSTTSRSIWPDAPQIKTWGAAHRATAGQAGLGSTRAAEFAAAQSW